MATLPASGWTAERIIVLVGAVGFLSIVIGLVVFFAVFATTTVPREILGPLISRDSTFAPSQALLSSSTTTTAPKTSSSSSSRAPTEAENYYYYY